MKIQSQNGIEPIIKVDVKDNDTITLRELPYSRGKKTVYVVSVGRPDRRGSIQYKDIAAFKSEEEAEAVITEINNARNENLDYKPTGISVWEGREKELVPSVEDWKAAKKVKNRRR